MWKSVASLPITNNQLTLTYNPIKEIVDYFYSLKGWDGNDKNFYRRNNINYERYVKPAKDLYELCDNDIDKSKDYLLRIRDWATGLGFDFSIDTVIRRYLDLENNLF